MWEEDGAGGQGENGEEKVNEENKKEDEIGKMNKVSEKEGE